MRPGLLLVAILMLATPRQDPPRQVFRSGIDLITVDAIVLDRQGNPVTDLTAADFVVTANKQLRTVRSAEFVAISTARPAEAALPDAEPVPSDSSNVGLPESRSFLIVVDVDQIRAGEGRVAMRAMTDFVSTLRPDDLAGVVALPYGQPRVDLTTNRAMLRTALGGIVGTSNSRRDPKTFLEMDMGVGEAVAIELGDQSVIDAWRARHRLEGCKGSSSCIVSAQRVAMPILAAERQHSRNLFDSLRALAAAMKAIRGIKTIVLVSEGMLRDRDVLDDLRRFAEAAAEARVTLYSLVLDTPQTEAADDLTRPPDRSLESAFRKTGMADAATAAGGDVFMISGTPVNALKRIDGELAGYYLLSFESDPRDSTDKRRSIEVKVRRPNLTVRARSDFSIPRAPTKPSAPAADVRVRMGELLKWPVPVAEVPLDLTTFAAAPTLDGSKRRVVIAAELPAGVRPAAAGYEIANDTGKTIADLFEPDPAVLSGPAGSTYVAAVLLDPGRYQLKFGVVLTDGRRGSIEHAVWVKPSPPAPVRLGDIVIGSETTDGFRPIVRIPPNAAQVAVRIELQATAVESFAQSSVLLDIARRGETAPFTSATMPVENTSDPLKRIAIARLTVSRLPAGEYILRATLQSSSSSERVSRLIRKR